MDVLSDVLRVIRLTGARFYRFELGSPWSVSSPTHPTIAEALGVTEDRCMGFHFIMEGACWLGMDGIDAVRFEAGDVAVLPRGRLHRLYDDARLTPRSVATLSSEDATSDVPHIRHGGSGPVTRILCGYLYCGQHFQPLNVSLPRLLCVRSDGGGDGQASGGPAPAEEIHVLRGDWLSLTLDHLRQEAERVEAGSMALLPRLGELLYVEVLRRYMVRARGNWLSAVNDADIGKVLGLIHAEPHHDWTVDELARRAGMSRSLLAQRFTALVGRSPMRYLCDWRVQVAMQLLSRPEVSVSQVADRVGYGSEAAFTRAFKRSVGQPPAAWRRMAAPPA